MVPSRATSRRACVLLKVFRDGGCAARAGVAVTARGDDGQLLDRIRSAHRESRRRYSACRGDGHARFGRARGEIPPGSPTGHGGIETSQRYGSDPSVTWLVRGSRHGHDADHVTLAPTTPAVAVWGRMYRRSPAHRSRPPYRTARVIRPPFASSWLTGIRSRAGDLDG